VLIVLVPLVDAAMIWMFKLVVDQVLRPADLGAFWPIAFAYLGLALLAGIVTFVDEYTSAWVGERFLLGLRTRVFEHVQGLSLDFFERRRLGDTLARLTGDVAAIESFVLSGLVDALSAIVTIAPCSCRLRAVASPRPDAPPTTIAALSAILMRRPARRSAPVRRVARA